MTERNVQGPTTLYRFYDEDGALLYVGVTLQPKERIQGHRSTSAWWDVAASARMERFPTRREALDAEQRAIATEAPLHNVVGAKVLAYRKDPVPVVLGDLMSPAKVAEAAGMEAGTLRQRFKRGQLPDPALDLEMGHIWLSDDIEEWIKQEQPAMADRMLGREEGAMRFLHRCPTWALWMVLLNSRAIPPPPGEPW